MVVLFPKDKQDGAPPADRSATTFEIDWRMGQKQA
jgi:hypothetical protein